MKFKISETTSNMKKYQIKATYQRQDVLKCYLKVWSFETFKSTFYVLLLENASHSKVRGQWDHSKTSKTARIKISLYPLISLKTRTISSRNSKLSIYIKNHLFFLFLCNRNICCRFLSYNGLRIFNWANFLVLFPFLHRQ